MEHQHIIGFIDFAPRTIRPMDVSPHVYGRFAPH